MSRRLQSLPLTRGTSSKNCIVNLYIQQSLCMTLFGHMYVFEILDNYTLHTVRQSDSLCTYIFHIYIYEYMCIFATTITSLIFLFQVFEYSIKIQFSLNNVVLFFIHTARLFVFFYKNVSSFNHFTEKFSTFIF